MKNLRHGGAGSTRRGPRRAGSAVGALLLVATLSGFGTAEAGKEEPAPVERHRPAASGRADPRVGGFYRGHLLPRMETRRASERPAASRASRPGLTIRHGLPVVELRRRMGRGLLRTGLSVDGRLRLEYRGGGFAVGGLRADYDPRRGEFNFACRLGF